MSQIYCINESRKGKHLTELERYKIEVLVREKKSPGDIAKRLDRNRRTIERELKRGQVEQVKSDLTICRVYYADVGQRKYEQYGANKGPALKIGHDHRLANHIEDRIKKERYSPDAVIGEINTKGLKFESMICTKTLYNYIDKGIFANISNKDLPVKRNKKIRKYKKVKVSLNNLKGTSIEERPESVDARQEYGHWEMDCVVGGQGGSGAALLVLSERQSRQEIIRKMPDKTQQSVIEVLDILEKDYGDQFSKIFKTITVDNGSEFLDFKALESSAMNLEKQRTKIYYAHPYSSWERGTNENSNKLIRRFIPKGTDIGKISDAAIRRIEHWMNNYPRRIFAYKTPNEMAS
ncbi:MAG: IS30 family transposase [Eubacteriales bacterium]